MVKITEMTEASPRREPKIDLNIKSKYAVKAQNLDLPMDNYPAESTTMDQSNISTKSYLALLDNFEIYACSFKESFDAKKK